LRYLEDIKIHLFLYIPMEKVLIIASCVAILYCLVKMAEMKFIEKELKPLKFIIRDTAIVFGCAVISIFGFLHLNGSINNFMNIVTETKVMNSAATEIFTDAPGF
jgi:hypothetical protein